MNNIQELIEDLKSKIIISQKDIRVGDESARVSNAWMKGEITAYDYCIHKLKLLLKDESKQPQPPDCANTMLGEVPQVVNDQQGENLKAVEGATPVVRQNEQTK